MWWFHSMRQSFYFENCTLKKLSGTFNVFSILTALYSMCKCMFLSKLILARIFVFTNFQKAVHRSEIQCSNDINHIKWMIKCTHIVTSSSIGHLKFSIGFINIYLFIVIIYGHIVQHHIQLSAPKSNRKCLNTILKRRTLFKQLYRDASLIISTEFATLENTEHFQLLNNNNNNNSFPKRNEAIDLMEL